jgi:hypothetical protein
MLSTPIIWINPNHGNSMQEENQSRVTRFSDSSRELSNSMKNKIRNAHQTDLDAWLEGIRLH